MRKIIFSAFAVITLAFIGLGFSSNGAEAGQNCNKKADRCVEATVVRPSSLFDELRVEAPLPSSSKHEGRPCLAGSGC